MEKSKFFYIRGNSSSTHGNSSSTHGNLLKTIQLSKEVALILLSAFKCSSSSFFWSNSANPTRIYPNEDLSTVGCNHPPSYARRVPIPANSTYSTEPLNIQTYFLPQFVTRGTHSVDRRSAASIHITSNGSSHTVNLCCNPWQRDPPVYQSGVTIHPGRRWHLHNG